MKEFYNDIDDKSRDAAQSLRIEFDAGAWDKMETLLKEEDANPAAPIISKTLTPAKEDDKNHS